MTSSTGERASLFNEKFLSETNQDANSALTELDKGLRSRKAGEQCEAIVRFPELFEKYPFPILINSSFLKLAEFFRVGSNLQRLWILRVCQQSEKHLTKILNCDEFVRRIFAIINSNDPIARTLTLKTLGAVAVLMPEKQQVHHAIRQALDSHDEIEVEAAISASVQFAEQSKTFCISMCSKIGSMIESLRTPISMKLQLIPVLGHMHHDVNTTAMVKTLCLSLLPKYPAESFIIEILDSLTKLSLKTLIDIPDQVNLLIAYLQDPRRRVRYQVLQSLQSLAKECAHLWSNGVVKILIAKAIACNDVAYEQKLVLTVVLTLTECPVTCYKLMNDEQSLILELCSNCLVLERHTAASQALRILTRLVSYCYTENKQPAPAFINLVNLHMESLIYSSIVNEKLYKELKQYLKCGVKLAGNNSEFGENFINLIGGVLTDDFACPLKHSILLCEAMAAVSSQFQVKRFSKILHEFPKFRNPIDEMLPQLLKKLDSIVETDFKEENVQVIEILSAVVLQSLIGCFMPKTILDTFDRITDVINCWSQYRIARSASRYGQNFLAARIYLKISNHVPLENLYFFIISLSQISQAECTLNHGLPYEIMSLQYPICDPRYLITMSLIERLDISISLYCKALASLNASSSPTNPLKFQTEFIKLRRYLLEALHNVLIVKNTQVIVPPPAIAATLAQNSRDYLQKYGRVTNQLRKAVKIVKTCEMNFSNFYKSAFDADPATLEFLEIIRFQCSVFSHTMEQICFVAPPEAPVLPNEGDYPETRYLINVCKRMEREAGTIPQTEGTEKTITRAHTDVLLNEIEILVKSPICMPRFFFQILQSTSIKLSITPQPRSGAKAVTVLPGSNVVIIVEGVIQHYGKTPSVYRSVDSVQLKLTSQLLSPQRNQNDIKQNNVINTLTQIVKPHRNFLSGHFLLPLNNIQTGHLTAPVSVGGQWQVTLDTFVIDENGVVWFTGPKSTLLVKVPEDLTKQRPSQLLQGHRF